MALQESVISVSMLAGGDYHTNQFYFVDIASDGEIDPVGSSGAKAVGVLDDKPTAAGQPCKVNIFGRAKVLTGTGGLDEGTLVMSDGTGKAIASSGSGKYVLGVCVKAALAGELAEVLLGINQTVTA